MERFIEIIPPGVCFKVFVYRYQKILDSIPFLNDNIQAMSFIMKRVELVFTHPEATVVKMYSAQRDFYIIGAGIC